MTFLHFVSLGANGMCAFKIATLPKETILQNRPARNSEGIKGNWELYAQVAFQRPETTFGTVCLAVRNTHLDDLINRDRRRLGVKTFDRKKGFEAAIALLRAPGSIGVLVAVAPAMASMGTFGELHREQ